jgi:hypothetical protein
MSTGRGSIGNDILIAMKCFWDGSYGESESGDEWITLAGFAAPDAVWAEFDDRWNTMLKERYPIAPYIHMIEMLDGEDPFSFLPARCSISSVASRLGPASFGRPAQPPFPTR